MNRASANLARVTVTPVSIAAAEACGDRGFALVLGNGRRIETGWNFDENQLARLIQIAGAA